MDNHKNNLDISSQQLVLREINNSPLVLQNKKDLHFQVGQDLFSNLDTHNYFYFVMNGKIKIFQLNLETGKEQILYLFSRGDMFDVVSLLDSHPNEYMSEVLEKTHVIQVPINDIRVMMEKDAEFRQYLYSYLAQKLTSVEDLAVSLSFYDVYQRIIQLFTRFTRTVNGKRELQVINNLRHEDIASMVGSARKVVNRTLQKLKKDDIIEISRKNIEIKNFQKLLDKLTINH